MIEIYIYMDENHQETKVLAEDLREVACFNGIKFRYFEMVTESSTSNVNKSIIAARSKGFLKIII